METILKELKEEAEKILFDRPEVRAIKIPLRNGITEILAIEIYWGGNSVCWKKMARVSEWGKDKIIITLCEKLEPLQMQVPFEINKEKGLEVLKNLLYGE
ncbi:MAG: hypothetical protein IKB70_00465 [Bacilli bacterium]|nr:hypothetical protein [Bacilli bacterium]